jgi:hypothetical protein
MATNVDTESTRPERAERNGNGSGDGPAVEALRRQLDESLYPTLAAALGIGFVLANQGRSEIGKAILRYAGGGVAGQTLRMIAMALAKIDPDKARAALELEGRLDEPVDVQAAFSELRGNRSSRDIQPQKNRRRGPASRRH